MPADQAETTAPEPPPAPEPCPNCGRDVPPGGRGLGRVFCDAKCRGAFNARMKARGAVLAPLVLTWVQHGNERKDPDSRAAAGQAMSQLWTITRQFLIEDRKAGRPPWKRYFRRLNRDTLYMDRRRGDFL